MIQEANIEHGINIGPRAFFFLNVKIYCNFFNEYFWINIKIQFEFV